MSTIEYYCCDRCLFSVAPTSKRHLILGLFFHYFRQGVKIIETPDQDETDFTKSVRETLKILTMERNDVVVSYYRLQDYLRIWATYKHLPSDATLHFVKHYGSRFTDYVLPGREGHICCCGRIDQ